MPRAEDLCSAGAADALQLHPIIVTFAFLLGAQLAGAIGAIVAIPSPPSSGRSR